MAWATSAAVRSRLARAKRRAKFKLHHIDAGPAVAAIRARSVAAAVARLALAMRRRQDDRQHSGFGAEKLIRVLPFGNRTGHGY